MLVLSRKIGEEIFIPDYGVAVQVLDIQGGRVRIGIAAPSSVRIIREELLRPPKGTGLLPGPRDGAPEPRGQPLDADSRGLSVPDSETIGRVAQLARWIAQRTCGRVRSLSVRAESTRLVVEGLASTYYARQLAQTAVREFVETLEGELPGEVEFHIEVVDADRPAGAASELI